MMMDRMRAHREGQSGALSNRKDLHTLAPADWANALTTTFRRGKRGIKKALAFTNHAFFAQRIRQLSEKLPLHLAFASLLKSAMHRFVVGIARRQHVTLRAGAQNHSMPSTTARAGTGLRPGRPSGMGSSG